tara:strand:+ start:12057 stop:12563 length:507 start_codon:yes stop_codon:yes gene_type:complete
MAIINNFLVGLVSFTGLIFGTFIAQLVKEELKPGHKYFIAFKDLLLLIIIGILLYYSRNNFLFLIIGLVLGLLLGRSLKNLYFYLGLGMASSFFLFKEILMGSLIFLTGLPHGTLISNLKKKELKNYVIKSLIFFLIPFISLIFNINTGVYPGLMIGGLIYHLKWPYS